VAEYPRRDNLTGDAPSGQTVAGYEREAEPSELVLLLGCPVDPRLGLRSRIGSYHSQPENPRPNLQPKESLA